MSIRCEQYRSLHNTRLFLRDILTPPAMPLKELRQRASSCLRHYPFLDNRGCPNFSSDDFECPIIEKEEQ